MKLPHWSWTLAIASGAVISISLIQLARQSASTSKALASDRSQAAAVGSHPLTAAAPVIRQDGPADPVSRSPETSIETPLTRAVAPMLTRTARAAAADGWVALNPPASTRDPVRRGTGEYPAGGEEPLKGLQQIVPAGQPRQVHVRFDPAVPGNSLIVDDQRATVEGVISSENADESEIQISIEKDPASGESATDRKAPSPRAVAWGLTYEEELFRTKWGWVAFAEVQRIAKQKAGSSR